MIKMKKVLKRLIKKKDFYTIICFYILSSYIIFVAKDFRVIPGVPRAQNPGFYPLLLSGLLIFLNTIYLIQILKNIWKKEVGIQDKNTSQSESALKANETQNFWGKSTKQTRRNLAVAIVMVFLYMYTLSWLGFFSSSFLFLFIITRVLFAKKKASNFKIILLTFVVTLVLFFIFDFLIGIRFPDGILF